MRKPENGGEGSLQNRRAVVIAVQTMLKPMLAAGIEPDFVTSLDYNTVSTRFFENLEESAGKSVQRRIGAWCIWWRSRRRIGMCRMSFRGVCR